MRAALVAILFGLRPPTGYAFVVDGAGNYVVDGNGAYIIVPLT
jgi:hypothetical protein